MSQNLPPSIGGIDYENSERHGEQSKRQGEWKRWGLDRSSDIVGCGATCCIQQGKKLAYPASMYSGASGLLILRIGDIIVLGYPVRFSQPVYPQYFHLFDIPMTPILLDRLIISRVLMDRPLKGFSFKNINFSRSILFPLEENKIPLEKILPIRQISSHSLKMTWKSSSIEPFGISHLTKNLTNKCTVGYG